MFQDYHCEPAIFVVDSSEPYFHVQVHFVIFNMCLLSTPFHILALRPQTKECLALHRGNSLAGPGTQMGCRWFCSELRKTKGDFLNDALKSAFLTLFSGMNHFYPSYLLRFHDSCYPAWPCFSKIKNAGTPAGEET